MARAVNLFRQWLKSSLLLQKLDNPLGYVLLTVLALVIGFLISVLKIKFGIVFLAGVIGIVCLAACFINTSFGIGVIIVSAFFIQFLGKYVNAPFGILLDGLIFVMLFGILAQQIRIRDWSFAKSPVSPWIIAWVLYNLLQVMNPVAESQMAWLYTVRSLAGQNLLFFIALYSFKSYQHIITTIKIILGMVMLAALYGLKQEFFGFTNTEMIWLTSDPERWQLIFQWSRLRIFSFFSDPTNYGMLMAYISLFCLILATGPLSWLKRGLLVFCAICMLLAMAYAGSRTPFVLFPFGVIVFMMMTLKKQFLLIGLAFFMFGVLFVTTSTSSAVIYRIQSSFNPKTSGDTMEVRFKNQKLIQPFIHSHPFGSGSGSTGLWGQRFTPHTWLASFAHDSGFVRIAVELGWIGLLLYCGFLFVVMTTAVKYYLRVKDPMIKTIYLGITNILFVLTLASYPQEAIVQLPTSIIYYTLLAAMVRLKDFDEYYQKHYEDKPNSNFKNPAKALEKTNRTA